MKKAALLIALVLLAGCSAKEHKAHTSKICGVWISCYEIDPMLKGGDFKNDFSAAADNLKKLGATDAFVHVRAFGESLFASSFYPQNPLAARYDFDVLEYMIETLARNGINFHAWINPFRGRDGTFADPASAGVREKILGEIREITENYKVCGIHFDDYFYEGDNALYKNSYGEYRAGVKNPVSEAEYRTANISWLISAAGKAAKSGGRDVLFSVSPAADIQKNKNSSFADVSAWCESGEVDMIIPQLYFGFDYPDERFRFNKLLDEWKELAGENVKLVIGLAAYKLGTDTGPDAAEWAAGADILPRQTEICLNDPAISGVCYFSYTHLFKEDDLHKGALLGISKYTASP